MVHVRLQTGDLPEVDDAREGQDGQLALGGEVGPCYGRRRGRRARRRGEVGDGAGLIVIVEVVGGGGVRCGGGAPGICSLVVFGVRVGG